MATRTPKTTTTPAKGRSATGGKKAATPKKVESAPILDQRIFNYPVSDALLSQVIHVYRANTHQNTSKAKNRGEVSKTHHKVYRQKGTGNARHGAKSAPIYVGGGVAHGPSGVQPALKRLNQKMRAAGLAGVLSRFATDKRLSLLALPQLKKSSTKSLKDLFKQDKSLLIYQSESQFLMNSVKNIKNLDLAAAANLNPYTAALHQNIFLTQAGHDALVARLLPLLKLALSTPEVTRTRGSSGVSSITKSKI